MAGAAAVGPATAKVGVPADYNLIVRSACNSPVHQVVVRVRVPNGVNVAATEPKASTENNILLWELGTLAPKQERNLIVRMIAETRGSSSTAASRSREGNLSTLSLQPCPGRLSCRRLIAASRP